MERTADMAESALGAVDYEALAAFRFAVRRYLAFTEAAARSVGLTSQQQQALLAIKAETRPMSVGELAAQLLLKHNSAVELMGRLEKAGFTARAKDPDDGRRILVSLTPAGEGVLAALAARSRRELRVIAPAFAGLLAQLDQLTSD